MTNNVYKIIGGIVLIILIYTFFWMNIPTGEIDNIYTSGQENVSVYKIAEGMGPITRVVMTPDERLMFVANLNGEVYVLERGFGNYIKQEVPFYKFETGYDYTSGDENGLTGIVVSNQYANNKKVFLLFAKKENGIGQSQILSLTAEWNEEDNLVGINPEVIFTGNVRANGAHQIQDGVSINIDDKAHLLFSIGESYIPSYSRQLAREAGKILLIQEDGSDPLGVRPYPDYPKVQVIGIRNVYGLDVKRIRDLDWVYMTDNGPDANDRILFAPIFDGSQYDFGWNGTASSLLQTRRDGVVEERILAKLWTLPVSPAEIIAGYSLNTFVASIFSSGYEPLSYIVEGFSDGQPNMEILVREKEATDLNNILGMVKDGRGNIFFGNFATGSLYRVKS